MAPTIGLVGADVLSQYDLLFDGPAHTLRLYAPPASVSRDTSAAARAAGWLPPGITASDCVPLTRDPNYPDRIFFPLEINGRVIHSMFDSGSPSTNTNLAGARVLGITKRTPNVQQLPLGLMGQFMKYNGQRVWEVPSGLTMTVASRPLADVPIYIYQHLPRETGADDAELSMGLDAIQDRLMFVSYSTRRVCLGKTSGAETVAHDDADKADASTATAPKTLLTVDVLAQMTTFWKAWNALPLAVRDTGRMQYQKPLPIMLDAGAHSRWTYMLQSVVDMETLAPHYPAVQAAFAAAHLTPAQWEQYRLALFTATLTEQLIDLQNGLSTTFTPPSSVAQNIAFLRAHQEAFSALQATGMWFPHIAQGRDYGGDLDP
jgi:hypothetical protein